MNNSTNIAVDAVKFAWRGEIYGMAFFQRFMREYPANREVWATLYDIEAFTEQYLRQRLEKQGLALSEDERQTLQTQGFDEVQPWLALDWQTLCVKMRDWLAPWLEKYAHWQQTAQSYQAEFALIHQHEKMIFDYFQAAAARDVQAYLRLCRAFEQLKNMALH